MWASSCDHVKENDTKAIRVDRYSQSLCAKEVFRQIPLGPVNGAEVGVLGLVHLPVHLPCDPKVTDFGKKVLVEKNICRLDVAVDESLGFLVTHRLPNMVAVQELKAIGSALGNLVSGNVLKGIIVAFLHLGE